MNEQNSPQSLIDLALSHHRTNQLDDAERIYQQLLAAEPDHADAMHLLGVIRFQRGQLDLAEILVRRSIELAPADSKFSNLGLIAKAKGNLPLAKEALERAYQLNPQSFATLSNLGITYLELQQFSDAEKLLRLALSMQPTHVETLNAYGNVLLVLGNKDEAVLKYRDAIRLQANYETPYINLARVNLSDQRSDLAHAVLIEGLQQVKDRSNILMQLTAFTQSEEQIQAAQQYCSEMLELRPGWIDAKKRSLELLSLRAAWGEAIASAHRFSNEHPDEVFFLVIQTTLYRRMNQDEKAIEIFNTVLKRFPSYIPAYIAFANLRYKHGDLDGADALYQEAIEKDVNCAEAFNGIGAIAKARGALSKASTAFQTAIEKREDFAEAHSNLATVLKELGELELARKHCEKAIALKNDFADAYHNYGDILQAAGHLDLAINNYQRALKLKPDSVHVLSNLGSAFQIQGRFGESRLAYERALELDPLAHRIRSNFLFLLSFDPDTKPEDYQKQLQVYDRAVQQSVIPYTPTVQTRTSRIRIGFVSGDFNSHPVGYFLQNFLQHFIESGYELFAFSNNIFNDTLTTELQQSFHHWYSIYGLEDKRAAALIRSQEIDLLIDLSGHTALNRLPVFAYRPARVQVSWLGYWASTGVSAIDYIVVDKMSVRPEEEGQFTEKALYLSTYRMCFTAPKNSPDVSSTPALVNGHLTVGCFQSLFKITDKVLILWSKLAAQIPNLRFRIQNKQMVAEAERSRMIDRLTSFGFSMERVDILGPSSRANYLAAYNEVDLVLDTFPYTGGTTTCEALWMGVPTVTLAGSTLLARQGVGLLSSVGLADMVADDEGAYVEIVKRYAHAFDELENIRQNLRERMQQSSLLDGELFGRAFAEIVSKAVGERVEI